MAIKLFVMYTFHEDLAVLGCSAE